MSGLVGVPPISVSPPECLFGLLQLDLGFWLKMLLRRRLWVEAQILPSVLWPSQVVVYISMDFS